MIRKMMPSFRIPKFFKSVRYLLAAFNGLFLLTGIVLLLLGVVVLIQFNQYSALLTNWFTNLAGFVLGTGVVICLAAVLGFYASVSENFYAVATYVGISLAVLVLELALMIVAFGLNGAATAELRPVMAQSVQLYSSRLEVARMWDELQRGFECCGVSGRNDWGTNFIPVSCCHIDFGTISPFECGLANAYSVGCANVLGAWLAQRAYAVAITASVIACIQLVLTALSGYLGWRSKFEEVELES